eukprot:Skav218998  [mRNA]  locus=scaffold169:358764:359561:+ [translate_table: standard]
MERANRVDSDGRTCLDRLVTLLVEVAQADFGVSARAKLTAYFLLSFAHAAAGHLAVRFVKKKLQGETVIQTFKAPSDELREAMWMLIQKKSDVRGNPRVGGLEGFGAEFMLALMGKGLPRWCWGGYARRSRDNLLQYILEEITLEPIMDHDKTEAERKLCLELATRFSLQELCYQNEHGQNALYYAVKFVAALQESPWDQVRDEAPAWMEVRDTIRQQMELRVREFQGNLMELVALTASVRDALAGALVVDWAALELLLLMPLRL